MSSSKQIQEFKSEIKQSIDEIEQNNKTIYESLKNSSNDIEMFFTKPESKTYYQDAINELKNKKHPKKKNFIQKLKENFMKII